MIVRINPWVAGAALTAGYLLGRREVRRHLGELRAREHELAAVVVGSERTWPAGVEGEGVLVAGSCVVGPDLFRRTVGYWRNRAGVRRAGYDEVLLERARREALLRLKEVALAAGARRVIDLRFETTTFAGEREPGPVEVLAVGTALVPRPS